MDFINPSNLLQDMKLLQHEASFRAQNWSFAMEYHMYSALQAIVSCLPLHLIYQAEQNNIAGNPLLGHLFPTHIDCKNLPRQMT